MPEPQVDLGSLFGAVSSSLAQNRDALNSADEYNANHGDNMVKNFQVITRAVNRKKEASPSEQLSYASQTLAKNSQSGSARLYSEGLARAAENLRGQPAITQENAMVLLQSLMGSQPQSGAQASSGQPGGDPLSGLLGSMLGGGGAAAGQPASDPLSGLLGSMLGGGAASGQPASDPLSGLVGSMLGGGTQQGEANPSQDMLGGLMSALTGGQQAQPQGQAPQQAGGVDLNTLLNAGMAFLQARQQGASPVQALANAVLAGSQMNATSHHSQSGQVVASSLISALTSMLGKNQ